MALTTLKEDLMQEFRAERDMVNEQMEMLDPLGTSLRRPAAQRLLSNTTLILTEFGCYGLFIAGIAFLIMANGLYPFSVMNTIYHSPEITTKIGGPNINNFILAGYGIIALGTVFILIIGRMAGVIRRKNEILHVAGKDIKIILGQHLERQAAIEAIAQRHHFDISGISIPAKAKPRVTEVMNPGYESDDEEDETEEN